MIDIKPIIRVGWTTNIALKCVILKNNNKIKIFENE